jgi:hypothetical protein
VEAEGVTATGPVVRIGRSEPLWLPIAGSRIYRELRRLLRAARAQAGDSLKLTVLDLPGKAHVEVLATVGRRGERSRTRSALFARCATEHLAAGFAETART